MATSDIKLRNKFFLIRHGEAENNVQHVLVSKPDIGIHQYGLTDKGRLQAQEAADLFNSMLKNEDSLNEKLFIVSSDFRRTRETAEILHGKLGVKEPIRFSPALRERGLGTMVNYDLVHQMWALDFADPTHNEFGVESVMQMVVRLSRIVMELDKEFTDRIVILVSHGDPCMCIEAVCKGVSPNEFRNNKDIGNCEIRELKDD